MIEAKDITFICHVRIDNAARKKNIETIFAYYKKHLPGCSFVFVEDDSKSKLNILLNNNDKYEFFDNKDLVKKSVGYNIGGKLANTDILIFLDIDIIIDCNKLLECINKAFKSNSLECLIGYNGCAFYMTQEGESTFLKTLNVSDLHEQVKNLNIMTGSFNEFALLGNTNAVGGCLVMTKQSFERINGFNPFFIGWGYEDNEIVLRAHKLGLNVSKSGISDHCLYHLPHSDPTINKSYHAHYKTNEAIYKFVSCIDAQHLLNYIKQW